MVRRNIPRSALVACYLLFVGVVAAGVWTYGYRQALTQVAARGASDLELAGDRLVTQLQRFREFAVLMVEHPALAALHDGRGSRAEADAILLQAADKTGAVAAVYTDTAGRVLARSGPELPISLVGQDFFAAALDGTLGAGDGAFPGTDGRGYAFAAPDFGPDGRVRGVLVVTVSFGALEQNWRGTLPAVFFTIETGEVLVTNRSEMLNWTKAAGGVMTAPDGTRRTARVREAGGHTIWQQDWSAYIPGRALYLTLPLPVVGLEGALMADVAPARRLAGLQAAAAAATFLFFGALLFLATERRRALAAANLALEERVAARTADLSAANRALRHEIAERQEAEAALKRAQADLVQAGKLSALGQMSAGISHELNQPLMAIGSFAENGRAFLDRGRPEDAGRTLERIGALAQRAARIIRNLRAFARNESEPMGCVDLVAVIGQAVELTEARLRAEGVTLDWTPPPGEYLALGGEVRLSQVFVNLINNAVDAMAGASEKRIRIALDEGPKLRVQVHDTGPGIADPDRIFEPFYTTKEVSAGMGLGLSISYGLVQSFGGAIRGANTETGAVFTVELDPWRADEVAA
ncbi:sensor histidine kinase [Thalassococcus profundi]|uniref:C4-dicarboxylate transport sensor protein DctB n=1 Tax=Thalassococcus profundi TaxID=2282382 RepID=A0A369TPW8_9RHOB|nr:ATP-binding protein [Thalassococcus profundi]RDD67339.1 sensor histidine kinase [Thalassococcus profundi]